MNEDMETMAFTQINKRNSIKQFEEKLLTESDYN